MAFIGSFLPYYRQYGTFVEPNSPKVGFSETSVIHSKLTHYPVLAEVAGYAECS